MIPELETSFTEQMEKGERKVFVRELSLKKMRVENLKLGIEFAFLCKLYGKGHVMGTVGKGQRRK